jgi:hypothetical protein
MSPESHHLLEDFLFKLSRGILAEQKVHEEGQEYSHYYFTLKLDFSHQSDK